MSFLDEEERYRVNVFDWEREFAEIFKAGGFGELMSWYFLCLSNIAQKDDFPKIVLKETRSLPIRPINFSDPADKARHDRMVLLVEQMLTLHKQLAESRTGHDTNSNQRQIDATDRQIDRLVYELYGLTEEEIAVVEGDS